MAKIYYVFNGWITRAHRFSHLFIGTGECFISICNYGKALTEDKYNNNGYKYSSFLEGIWNKKWLEDKTFNHSKNKKYCLPLYIHFMIELCLPSSMPNASLLILANSCIFLQIKMFITIINRYGTISTKRNFDQNT